MRHLKPDEVEYTTRPRTILEEQMWVGMNGMPRSHPQYYHMWAQFLWMRQDEVLSMNLFVDILITDFDDHQQKCIAAMSADDKLRECLRGLEGAWRFQFNDRPFDDETKSRLREWHEFSQNVSKDT